MGGGLSQKYDDRPSPVEKHFDELALLLSDGRSKELPPPVADLNRMTSEVIRMFAVAAQHYCRKSPDCDYGVFAEIAVKNRQHGAQNSNALLHGRPIPTVGQVYIGIFAIKLQFLLQARTDRMLCEPITQYESSLTACGAAAAVVCSGDSTVLHVNIDRNALDAFLSRLPPPKTARCVRIAAQRMVTDLPTSFAKQPLSLIGCDMARRAADLCYRCAS